MKNQLKFISLFVILGMQLSSCMVESSGSVSPDKIYTEYEMFYNVNTNTTEAFASFRFSHQLGTLLQLNDSSYVLFNGDTLPYVSWLGIYYKSYPGKIATGNFEYKDSLNNVYNNTITLTDSISNVASLDTIKRSLGSYNFTWGGGNIGADQSVGIVINSTVTIGNFQSFITNTVGTNSMMLPITQLNLLPIGTANSTVDRQKEINVYNHPGSGGKIRSKFRGVTKNIVIQ